MEKITVIQEGKGRIVICNLQSYYNHDVLLEAFQGILLKYYCNSLKYQSAQPFNLSYNLGGLKC